MKKDQTIELRVEIRFGKTSISQTNRFKRHSTGIAIRQIYLILVF